MTKNTDDERTDDDVQDFGPCCVCESTDEVHTILMLEKKAPITGRGWGCVVCDLPSDGAVAVVCDSCAAAYDGHLTELPLRFACRGYPGKDGRVPIDILTGTHDHDYDQHPPEERPLSHPPKDEAIQTPFRPRPGFNWTQVRWSGPLALVDDTCSYCGAAIPDEHIPLRLFSQGSWAAVFCHACMTTWWGMQTFDDPDDDYRDTEVH